MAELQLLPKCPKCDRLTVDNKHHCPDKSASKWAETCGTMICTACRWVYSTASWPGFQNPPFVKETK